MINVLQLLTFLTFINVYLPVNVGSYLKALFELANLDLLPTDNLEEYILEEFDQTVKFDNSFSEEFNAQEILNPRLIENEYEEPYVIHSSILLYSFYAFALALALLVLLLNIVFWKL